MINYKVTLELRFSEDEEPETDVFYVRAGSEFDARVQAYEQACERYVGQPFVSKVVAVHQQIG